MKQMFKMMITCVALAVIMLVVNPGTAAAASGEISFLLMNNADDEIHVPWLENHASEFEKKTGVKVKFEIIGWDTAWQRISTAIASGEGPDVMMIGATWNPQFAATGGLTEVDLADFGGKEAFLGGLLPQSMYEGKYYGVPWFTETRVLFYNKDMFAQAGVEVPKTYDELVEVGKKITAKFGEGSAISIPGTNAWDLPHSWVALLWALGGQVLNTENTNAVFNGTEGVAALNWYVDLFKQGLAAKACAEYESTQSDAAFTNGNVAMTMTGPWNIAAIKVQNPKLNYGIAELPAGPKGKAAFTGGENLVILGSSLNKEAAKAWINYLLQPDVLTSYTELTDMLPATKAGIEVERYAAEPYNVFKKTLQYATAYPPVSVWGDIEESILQGLKKAITEYVNGSFTDTTAQTCLNDAAKSVNASLAKK